MTAGRLAERVRLSPGAITAVIDRLEENGLARRTRDTRDRRRVLVEVAPDLAERAAELYGTPEEGAAALSIYSDDQLEFLIGFLRGSVAYPEERLRRLKVLRGTARGSRRGHPPRDRSRRCSGDRRGWPRPESRAARAYRCSAPPGQ
jgi:DNA-binding MarR family transcriptional regulator